MHTLHTFGSEGVVKGVGSGKVGSRAFVGDSTPPQLANAPPLWPSVPLLKPPRSLP